MLQGRVLCRISLVIILLITISAYGPWDFQGAYDKAEAAALLKNEQWVKASGDVYHKEIKKDKVLYYVKNASVTSGSGTLSHTSFIFKFDSDIIPNYSKLNIEGLVKHFSSASNDGCFDMKKYYNSMGLYFELVEISDFDYSCSYFSRLDIGYKIRQHFSMIFQTCLPGEEAGFLSSVVIGEKSGLDSELKQLFQNVGIAHILAVSGLHVSVVCMAFYKLLRKLGLRFGGSSLFAGTIAIFYGIITGGSVSSIRAIGMFLIYLLAQVTGESYDMLTATALMADLLLFDNPLYIKNGSFIFSFGAVIGILYFVLPLCNVYTNYYLSLKNLRKPKESFYSRDSFRQRVHQYFMNSFIFSLGMFVAMLPIVTQLYYQTPLYSTILNLLVLPLMPLLLGVGVVAGIVGTVFLPGAKVLLYLCHLIIYFYELISAKAQSLPFSTIVVGSHSGIALVVYYMALIFVIHGIDFFLKHKSEMKRWQLKNIFRLKVLLIMLLAFVWMAPRNGSFEIDILDVGQGDGIYINSGDGVHFFIDGGSTSSDAVGEYTILPFLKYKGASTVDYWFVSHTDEDHISGLIEVLDSGYAVKNIVFTNYIIKEDNDAFQEIEKLASEKNVKILYMNQGDIIGCKHMSFKCVYPSESIAKVYDDVNALSLSLVMNYDKKCDGKSEYTAFFGGDIAAEQESVIATSGLVGHVNLLKVSHHGSRFSSDSSFLDKLSPDVAVISCAKKNRYGHPSAEAVERIESSGAEIYYTMNSGRIRIDDNGLDGFVK